MLLERTDDEPRSPQSTKLLRCCPGHSCPGMNVGAECRRPESVRTLESASRAASTLEYASSRSVKESAPARSSTMASSREPTSSSAACLPAPGAAAAERVAAHVAAGTGIRFARFAEEVGLLPLLLQPAYVVVALGQPCQLRLVTYGYVVESAASVQGDRPDRKHTPLLARLVSPELAEEPSEAEEQVVSYVVRRAESPSIAECVDRDAKALRAAIKAAEWSPLLGAS
mmetsp:Transcript_105775/g.320991  ORF Transcript_105775/g.320991 Transcript_105775/m.320991 type:complete len:228 (+) Transcript_105775:94-777(+)